VNRSRDMSNRNNFRRRLRLLAPGQQKHQPPGP
jgi:hypothetical protein